MENHRGTNTQRLRHYLLLSLCLCASAVQTRCRFMFQAVTLCMCLFVAGCAVGPNYHRPKLDLPANFRFEAIPASTNSIADLPWWEIFQDDDLRQLIRTAYTNNYDLRMGIARVEQAHALLEQARGGFFPQLNYQGSVLHGKNATATGAFPTGGKTTSTFVVECNPSWVLDLCVRIRRSI